MPRSGLRRYLRPRSNSGPFSVLEAGNRVSPIKVLFVTTEVAGLAKAGGLGEVSAGLPPALQQRGIDVRLLMPAYRDVAAKLPPLDWIGDLPGRAAIPAGRLGRATLP